MCDSALEALHNLNICHGDVKLENALVFAQNEKIQWRVKLCDFGHARYAQEDEVEDSITLAIGTRLLCAPELYSGKSAGGGHFNISDAIKTDIFSFGLVLWETLKH
jgi:serine/threonine protein kinase